MKCELYFYYDEKDCKNLDKLLNKFSTGFQIITTSSTLNESLKKNGFESKTLREIFPEEGKNSYKVFKRSKKIQEEYRNHFSNVKFKDIPIFPGIENQLLDEIIRLENARAILEDKKNILFILEGFSFTYFSFKKIAKELDYDTDFSVGWITDDRIKWIYPEEKQSKFFRRNQLKSLKLIIKSLVKPKDPKGHFINHILKPNIEIFRRLLADGLLFYFILLKLGFDVRPIIFKRIRKEILSTQKNENFFFLTTNTEDLYLKSIYPLIEKFVHENIKHKIITIDLVTNAVLTQKKIKHIDLFNKIFLLSELIKRNSVEEIISKINEIAKKKDLSLVYFKNISDHFVNEICRTISIIELADFIFSQNQIKNIIVAVDGVMFGNSIISTARRFNVTSFFIPSVIINNNPLHADWYNADKICVYGQQGLNTLESLGYDENRLILTGNPKYDFLKKIDHQASKIKLSQMYNIDLSKKLVVIALARWHEKDEIWMSDLIRFCNKEGFEIIVKIHPMYSTMLKEESASKIHFIEESCHNLKFLIEHDIDLPMLLSAADLVITDYSNVGVEAIILEKPLLTVNFSREDLIHEQRYHEYDAALYFEEYFEIEDAIKDLLTKGKYLDSLKQGREKIIEMYNYYNDGRATQRVFDLITNNNRLKKLSLMTL